MSIYTPKDFYATTENTDYSHEQIDEHNRLIDEEFAALTEAELRNNSYVHSVLKHVSDRFCNRIGHTK